MTILFNRLLYRYRMGYILVLFDALFDLIGESEYITSSLYLLCIRYCASTLDIPCKTLSLGLPSSNELLVVLCIIVLTSA